MYKRQKEYGLGKHLVDFILHPVAETVDGDEIRFLISGQPDIMDVTVKELFNFPAGVDVVHIDRKSTRLNSSHSRASRMPSSA